MGKGDGILLGRYIQEADEPAHLIRKKLNSGELRHSWIDADGDRRFSDDGGPQPPPGWWLRPVFTEINLETSDVREHAPHVFKARELFGSMYRVRVYPAVEPKAKRRGRPGDKSGLVAEILANIDQSQALASDLKPAEIEKKVLPEFRRRWAKLKPNDKTEPPVSRRAIARTYQEYIEARSSK